MAGAYAAAFVAGFQTAREAPYPLQAVATCKHLVANEYEGHREGMDVILSAQDLVDSCAWVAEPRQLLGALPSAHAHALHPRPFYSPLFFRFAAVPELRGAGEGWRHHVCVCLK